METGLDFGTNGPYNVLGENTLPTTREARLCMSQIKLKASFRLASVERQKLYLMSVAMWIRHKWKSDVTKAAPQLMAQYRALLSAPGARGCYMDLESSWRKYCRLYPKGDPVRWFMFAVNGSLRNNSRELSYCLKVLLDESQQDIHEGIFLKLWADNATDMKPYAGSTYSPLMRATAKAVYQGLGDDPLDLSVLADQLEDEGLPESSHFRCGIHTIACPVLLRIMK